MKTWSLLPLFVVLGSCGREHPIVERNTAGNCCVEWVSRGNEPLTCFITHGRESVVENVSPADQPAAFQYGSLRFEAIDDTLRISTASGAPVESLPMKDWIFILAADKYTKIAKTPMIRQKMKEDYSDWGDGLINELKAAGKL